MSLRTVLGLAVAFMSFGLSAADCQFPNTGNKADERWKKAELCKPQGPGVYTFSFYTSATNVPSLDPDNPAAGYVAGETYILYDNTCKVLGVYPRRKDSGCSLPWIIRENFLPYQITITDVFTGLGGSYYKYQYANGEYTIKDNGCGCSNVSEGLVGAEACKCAFPVHGQPVG